MLYIALMVATLFLLIIGLTCAFVGLHHAIEIRVDKRRQDMFAAAIIFLVGVIIFNGFVLADSLGKG